MVIARAAQPRLQDLLGSFPAVALLGPRQAGKTTLARALADAMPERAVYLDLELPSDRAKLSDAELYLSGHENQLVILDEIQRAPGLFQTLRGIIDQRRRKGIRTGEFLLLGSASMDLLEQSAESLAGLPLHFGHHATSAIPTLCLIQKANIPDHRCVRGTPHRSGHENFIAKP